MISIKLSKEQPFELPEQEVSTEDSSSTGLPFKVILYNDDWHSFDEVIVQLIKAINCSFETARSYAFEVHVKGKAIVFNGPLPQCLKVSSVLEEIALHTQVVS